MCVGAALVPSLFKYCHESVSQTYSIVAMAQPMFLSENGHCVPNKFPKILKIFKSVEWAKSQGACFRTKEFNHPFLGYSDSFDLTHGLAPNQSHVNSPGMDDLIP